MASHSLILKLRITEDSASEMCYVRPEAFGRQILPFRANHCQRLSAVILARPGAKRLNHLAKLPILLVNLL